MLSFILPSKERFGNQPRSVERLDFCLGWVLNFERGIITKEKYVELWVYL